MKKVSSENVSRNANYVRLNVGGLILLILAVMAATALISTRAFKPKAYSFTKSEIPDPDAQDENLFTRSGRWGELLTQNIWLELPEEYIGPDERNPQPVTWNFSNLNLSQVKAVLTANGLTPEEVESQLTIHRIAAGGTNFLFTPNEDFLLSLKPKTRGRLYRYLRGKGVDESIDHPYMFSKETIARICADPRLNPEDVAVLKQLVYPEGNSYQLSDNILLLRKIPTVERRLVMSKAISLQPAVLARVCVRPDSDIDKIAAYWGHMDNVRFTDMRPLLEALKGLPHGGTISLMYFMPPFARARLYTYPLPPKPGEPRMDCHWSTFNFCSIELNNDINDSQYLTEYVRKNFYKIDAPTEYGDVLVYLDEQNVLRHSAVFVADDLVFTKYGGGYRQPWMLARMADIKTMYPATKVVFFRPKTE